MNKEITPAPAGEPTPTPTGEPAPAPAGEPTPEPPAPAAASLTPELVQQMIDASLGAFSDAMQITKAAEAEQNKLPDEKTEETDPNKKTDENNNQNEVKNEW